MRKRIRSIYTEATAAHRSRTLRTFRPKLYQPAFQPLSEQGSGVEFLTARDVDESQTILMYCSTAVVDAFIGLAACTGCYKEREADAGVGGLRKPKHRRKLQVT